MSDSDGDGIPDDIEISGIPMSNGLLVYTNPNNSDTDGDSLTDGEEVGTLVRNPATTACTPEEAVVYKFYFNIKSDPTKVDSDGDLDLDNFDPYPKLHQLNDMFLYNIEKLRRLAYNYNHNNFDVLMKYSIDKEDWIVMMFIRQFNNSYVDGNWPVVGGDIDYDFIEYVKNNDFELYEYFSNTDSIYANEQGELLDIQHMAATFTVYAYKTDLTDSNHFNYGNYDKWYHFWTNLKTLAKNTFTVARSEMFEQHLDNLGGWAGDLQTIMVQAYKKLNKCDDYNIFYNEIYSMIGNSNYKFDMQDMYADTDAYNIYILLENDNNYNIISALKYYYSYGYRKRYSSFVNNWSRSQIEDLVEIYTNSYFLIENDSLVWPLFKENNVIYKFTENQSKASTDAFVDFLMEQVSKE